VSAEKDLVLVADDDEDIVRFVEVNLRLEGFDVATASDGEQALKAARELGPDLVLLDVMMPVLDGFEVCHRLRTDPTTRHISVIMLTAKSMSADRVVGLTAGADDYMIKPFDPTELVARVKSALRRSREMRDVNPLTHLPGNIHIQEEVARRVASGEPFALMHIDLDNFKAFNDHYGFLRGDEAIKLLAHCVGEAVGKLGVAGSFVGHVGGDDFVVIGEPESAEVLAKDIIELWDSRVAALYDAEDARRGFIEVEDRRGQMHRYSMTTVSVGIASSMSRALASHWAAAEIATEMKAYAKRQPRSGYAIDRRRDGERE
jgi:diguanylate cyclase (GGDEF)-like protein